jgi:hypothetical protein
MHTQSLLFIGHRIKKQPLCERALKAGTSANPRCLQRLVMR